MNSIELPKSTPLLSDNYSRLEKGDNNIPHPRLLRLASELPVDSTVLDIGAGFGRASMPFALRGMEVTALDEINAFGDELDEMAQDGIIFHHLQDTCPTDTELPQYDVVLINDVLFHAKSEAEALAMLDWAYEHTKSGGFLWANYIVSGSAGHMMDLEESYRYNSHLQRVNDAHFVGQCACSGIVREEDILFVPPLLYPSWAASRGATFADVKISGGTYDEFWDSTCDVKEYLESKDKCYLLLQKP